MFDNKEVYSEELREMYPGHSPGSLGIDDIFNGLYREISRAAYKGNIRKLNHIKEKEKMYSNFKKFTVREIMSPSEKDDIDYNKICDVILAAFDRKKVNGGTTFSAASDLLCEYMLLALTM